MRASTGLALAVLVLSTGLRAAAADGALNEYTLTIPADMPADHTLCQVNIDHADLGIASATMLHEDTAPLNDGGALQASRTDQVFRAWIADRSGVRTFVLQTTVSNVLTARVGFCGPDGSYREIVAPMTGGSPDEADLRGVYDGHATVIIELCGVDDGFELMEQFNQVFTDALQGNTSAEYVHKTFSSDKTGAASHSYLLANYPASLNQFVAAIRPGMAGIAEFDYVVGNRILLITGCNRQGLWVTVARGDQVVWKNTFTGFRLIAARTGASNLFVTYAAGSDNVYLNIAEATEAGRYGIVAAPGDDDERESETFTWAMAHFGGRPGQPHAVKSIAGSLRLTALAATKGVSGYFSFRALDENGVEHDVWGGFRDVTIR